MAQNSRSGMSSSAEGAPIRVRIRSRHADAADGIVLSEAIAEVYEAMFRRFSPFCDRDIDLIPTSRDRRVTDIDVLYPDRSPAVVSYVEPASPPFGTPRLRLKHRSTDSRILTPGGRAGPLLAHELSHALHFSMMPVRRRAWITARYLAWIGKELTQGRSGTHQTFQRTSAFVAWIEAFGLFAERYWRFISTHSELSITEQDEAFLSAESGYSPCRNDLVGSFDARGFAPVCPGADVEGTVYGLVFVDLAQRIGLQTAVTLYMRSARYGVLDYAGFVSALEGSGVQLSAAD